MTAMDFDLAAGTAVLERTPRALRAMLDGLPDGWIDANEGPDTWSPRDVVVHLVNCDRTNWIPRARVILAQGADRAFPPFDRFAEIATNKTTHIAALLDDFADARAQGLAELAARNISEAQLDLHGTHPALGTATLRQLLSTWVAHDLAHTAQIARVMARQYRDAVGPWRLYLTIMDR